MQAKTVLLKSSNTEPGFPPNEIMDDQDKHLSDQELFIRVTFQDNPKLGCELLFRRHYIELCSHAVRFLGSKAVAEDLVADIFCNFYEKQIFSTIETSYRAYLFKTVRNRAYNYVRQNFNRDTTLDDASLEASHEEQQPDAITQYDELYVTVERAIDSLPFQRRRVYLMNRFDGKKYAEIAQELGISVRTVEVHIRLATITLRDLLRYRCFLIFFGTIFGFALKGFIF